MLAEAPAGYDPAGTGVNTHGYFVANSGLRFLYFHFVCVSHLSEYVPSFHSPLA